RRLLRRFRAVSRVPGQGSWIRADACAHGRMGRARPRHARQGDDQQRTVAEDVPQARVHRVRDGRCSAYRIALVSAAPRPKSVLMPGGLSRAADAVYFARTNNNRRAFRARAILPGGTRTMTSRRKFLGLSAAGLTALTATGRSAFAVD